MGTIEVVPYIVFLCTCEVGDGTTCLRQKYVFWGTPPTPAQARIELSPQLCLTFRHVAAAAMLSLDRYWTR